MSVSTGDRSLGSARWAWMVLVASMVTFLPGLRAPYLWDDHYLIEHNTNLRDNAHLLVALTHHLWDVPTADAAGMHPNRYYRPVITLVYALQWRLFHGAPLGFHAVSIVLHGVSVWMAMAWLRRRVGGPHAMLASALGGALFALHPSRPESVTWIAGCTDLWMSLGVLAALHAWDRKHDALAATALVLAMLAKETAIVVPVLLASDALLLTADSTTRRHALRRVAWVSGALCAAFAIRMWLVPPDVSHLHGGATFSRATATLGWYVRGILWRWPASFQLGVIWYDAVLRPMFASWAVALGTLTGALALGLSLGAIGRPTLRPWVADLAWCLVPLFPVLNLLDTHMRVLGETHNLYIPVLGVAALMARAVAARATDIGEPRVVLFGVLMAACLGTACVIRELDLLQESDLFAAELRAEPRSPSAQREVVATLLAEGRFAEARDLAAGSFRMAMRGRIDEVVDFPSLAAEAQMNLCTDADQGCLGAVRDFLLVLPDPTVRARLVVGRFSLDVPPGNPWRRALASGLHRRVVVAVAEARTGQLANAEATLRSAAVQSVAAVPAWGTLALVLAREERWTEARNALAQAEALSPGDRRLSDEAGRLARAGALSRASASANDPIATGALRAQMFIALGAPVLARQVVDTLASRHPDRPEVGLVRAQVDAADRRPDLARDDLLAARASDLAHTDRWDEALRRLESTRSVPSRSE